MCVVRLRGAVVGDDVGGRCDVSTQSRGRGVPFLLSEQVDLDGGGVGFEGRFRGGWVKTRCLSSDG